jgi:hypothetical protein
MRRGCKGEDQPHLQRKKKFEETLTTNDCTYDYLSVLALIRNLDYSDMKPGDSKRFTFFREGRS